MKTYLLLWWLDELIHGEPYTGPPLLGGAQLMLTVIAITVIVVATTVPIL